jgi:hypothetical protein
MAKVAVVNILLRSVLTREAEFEAFCVCEAKSIEIVSCTTGIFAFAGMLVTVVTVYVY